MIANAAMRLGESPSRLGAEMWSNWRKASDTLCTRASADEPTANKRRFGFISYISYGVEAVGTCTHYSTSSSSASSGLSTFAVAPVYAVDQAELRVKCSREISRH